MATSTNPFGIPLAVFYVGAYLIGCFIAVSIMEHPAAWPGRVALGIELTLVVAYNVNRVTGYWPYSR